MNKRYIQAVLAVIFTLLSSAALAVENNPQPLDFTAHWIGIAALVFFVLAYVFVISEEALKLRKSKPVMVAAGMIWVLVALAYVQQGDTQSAAIAIRHNLLEFTELFLFLLAAMTYINAMDERGIFNTLRIWLVSRGYTLRKIFWITGLLAFFISPIADNLTTSLLMATVIMAIGQENKKFIILGCINIVIAANAGGAFSPFGDVTTLMVWQKGLVPFGTFFVLFIPSVVNWLVPAIIISFSLGGEKPEPIKEKAVLQHGAFIIVGLFLITITLTVSFHNYLHLPPVIGMMTGLGLLKLFGYYLKVNQGRKYTAHSLSDTTLNLEIEDRAKQKVDPNNVSLAEYNIFKAIERAEWDTLMFFYGIILSVGGLGTLGYLAVGSEFMYGQLGPTTTNILIGILSALIDNIPVMFAVLTMMPDMSEGQWLLVTLTAGVGGSMLSIGSAAGVAVMGQARGIYTFFAHLKWSWAIALGYSASIWVHFIVNSALF